MECGNLNAAQEWGAGTLTPFGALKVQRETGLGGGRRVWLLGSTIVLGGRCQTVSASVGAIRRQENAHKYYYL